VQLRSITDTCLHRTGMITNLPACFRRKKGGAEAAAEEEANECGLHLAEVNAEGRMRHGAALAALPVEGHVPV
jgi:hypothetical protein